MKSFDKIEAMAGKHHGGPKGIARVLGEWQVDTELVKKKDSRFLAGMAKAVFSSGFSWQVIEKKWPGFEIAFEKFDPTLKALLLGQGTRLNVGYATELIKMLVFHRSPPLQKPGWPWWRAGRMRLRIGHGKSTTAKV